MDLKYAFRRLNKLSFKQVVELVNNHPYYVKDVDKEAFLKEIAKAGDFFATEDGFKTMFVEAIKKYADNEYLALRKKTYKPEKKNYDSEATIIINNIIWKTHVMSSVIRFLVALGKIKGMDDEILDGFKDFNFENLTMLCENCDLFTTPEKEQEFTSEFSAIFKEYQKLLFSKRPDNYQLNIYKTKVILLIDKYFDRSIFDKKLAERTKYQYCDKALLSNYLDRMDKTQLINLYFTVIKYRHDKHLFMSNQAKVYFMDCFNKEELKQHPELKIHSTCSIQYGDYLVNEPKQHLINVMLDTPIETFRNLFLKFSNLDLHLWEYAAKSLLENDYQEAIKLIDLKVQSI